MTYFDYNASAPLLTVVKKQVGEWLDLYAVASNTHSREGRRAKSFALVGQFLNLG
jgi:hypothetical protein